jgi:2-methylcitrate dehydratase PrpD
MNVETAVHRATTSPAPTRALAEWLAQLQPREIPDGTRQAIRAMLLDTLGVALYGLDQPWTRAARAWAERGAEPAGARGALASLWGDGRRRLRPGDAALVNGVAAHAFELDDFHNAKLHPGAVVVPAALALGEALDAPGERLETALVAGYEVMIRAGLALDPSVARLRGWHLTGVCGGLGAAAAGAVLLGLDTERAAWALGLGGTQAAGLFAFNADGAMSKRFHPGRAAQSGVLAAELASLGFSGPTQLFETADGGFLSSFSDASRAAELTADLGVAYRLDATSFKPYSCCGSLHSYIDAALALRPKFLAARAGAPRVRAGMSRVVDVQCGFDYRPGSALNAQMSARYCIAAALTDGAVLPAQFAPARVASDDLVALAGAVELVPDPALDAIYPQHFIGWVELDGERVTVRDPSGSPENPARDAALRQKFHSLLADRVPEASRARLEAAVDALERTSARALGEILTVKP